ncbi:MAG: murein biosynthesis integral membrane protein MurJ [Victivallales bacterium]|nr:murein biosynthesis integral membrane protein MurJ [Victivallales bacterium]
MSEKGHTSRIRLALSMLLSGAGIFCSRIFGLLRDVVMTWYWGGSGAAQAAFHLAFSIPNMFRMLFGEGAFTAAFVPSLAGKLETGSRDEAWRFAERVITLQALALAGMVVLVSLVSLLIGLLLPASVREHIVLTFRILPLLMPYLLLICIAGCFGCILNALRRFVFPSLNPVLFNIVQICAVLLISRFWKNDEPMALYCFCGSVLLAGVVQMLSLMFLCRLQGFVFHFRLEVKNPDVLDVCRKMLPGIIGAGTNQINQCIDKIMVGYLGTLAVSSLSYSNHLVYLPVGIFGVAIGNVCLTELSRASSRKDMDALSNSLTFSLQSVLFLSIPCAVIFYLFAEPFIRLLFFRGAFNEEAVKACAYALKCYILGIPAYCMMKVATTPHHASGDTRTPMRVGIACVGLNFIMNISLIWSMKQGGLALSTSISSWVQVISLLFLICRKIPQWKPGAAALSGLLCLGFALIAGFASLKISAIIAPEQHFAGFWLYFMQVLLGGGVGGLIYLALAGIPAIVVKRKRRS